MKTKRVSYNRSGKGQKILLLHGIPGSRKNWAKVTQELGLKFDILAPDLIGFGDSEPNSSIENLWADAQAQSILRLLNELAWNDISVVGHDFGGPVAIHLYKLAPEKFKSLTLLSTNMFPDTPVPFPLSGLFFPVIGKFWSHLIFSRPSLSMMVKQGMRNRRPENLTEYLGSESQSKAISIIFESALRNLKTLYGPILEIWRNVEIPRQVIWGDKDPFFPVVVGKKTAEINRASFHLLKETGHFLPEERPAEIANLIRSIMS